MRTWSGPYVLRIWSIVGSTREQNGHWKSENSTIVTRAVRLPHTGSLLETGIGDSASFQAAAEEPPPSPPTERPWLLA